MKRVNVIKEKAQKDSLISSGIKVMNKRTALPKRMKE